MYIHHFQGKSGKSAKPSLIRPALASLNTVQLPRPSDGSFSTDPQSTKEKVDIQFMTRTITITGKDRPELFRQTLLSLVANDIQNWKIGIAIEPGPKAAEFVDVSKEILGDLNYSIAINDTVLGIMQNPFRLIERTFNEGSEINLCLEEDLLLAPDATQMALWYERNHRSHWLCMCLLAGPCGSAGMISNRQYPHVLFEGRTFNSIGLVLRKEEWSVLAQGVWTGEGKEHPFRGGFADWRFGWGWDWSVYGYLATRPELRCVQPAVARATHNGPEGTYSRKDFHDKAFGILPLNQLPVNEFELIEVDSLPHELRSHVYAHEEMTSLRLELEAVDIRHRLGMPPSIKSL